MVSLTYRRPSYVSLPATRDSLLSSSSAWSAINPTESISNYVPPGVPAGLSFDRILSGKTQKPCSLRDFMNYLIYVERSAENLQFYLWYKDYMLRFSKLPSAEKSLSPLWMNDKPDKEGLKPVEISEKIDDRPSSPPVAAGSLPNFDMTLDLDAGVEKSDVKVSVNQWDTVSSVGASTRRSDFRRVAADAFESHNIVAPFTIQPYREEVTRIIATYVAEGAPRELNISSKDRRNLLHALASTTHPSAFGRVAATVETSLRHQSHPNFVRHSIQNGHDPRIVFAVALGAVTLALGLVFALLFTLSGIPRGYRALSSILFMIGFTTLFLSVRGMCAVLNVSRHCHLQPWELFEEEPDDVSIYNQKNDSFDSFGSSNSWEDQPWVSKYQSMSTLGKIFSREQYINDAALRQVQFTMLLQSLLAALAGTVLLEAIFLSVPGGHFF